MKTLEKHHEKSAKKQIEAHIERVFEADLTTAGLVMVDQEKQ